METADTLLKPGEQIKPNVPSQVIHSLLKDLYNLEVESFKELNSYDDKNFFIKVKDSCTLPDPSDACPDGYVLKVLNSLDSKALNLIDAQNEMMLFLGKNGINCPKPVKNVSGKRMSLEELKIQVSDEWLKNNDADNHPTQQHVVRLLTFLPGEILFNVPYTKELFYQVGELAAKIDLTLMGFKHDGIKGVDRLWNLNRVPNLVDFVYAVEDTSKHRLAMEVITNFQSYVVPHLQELESGPIHGDFNEQNILVRQTENQPRNYQLSGVLDFGDINYNFYVFELAIALCYMMIECKCMNALDAPGHVLAGYNRVRAIPEKEFIILKDCIAGRLSQSLIMGAYSNLQNPDPYVLTTAAKGWDCLRALWDCPKDELYKRWRFIMDTYENN